MSVLLDANVPIALTVSDHVHHDAAQLWFAAGDDVIATSPVTQGALVRFLLRAGAGTGVVRSVLASLAASPRHEFWSDDLSYTDVDLRGVIGHRQVTDAYLASLARAHGTRLITLDQGLAALHPDIAQLLPG